MGTPDGSQRKATPPWFTLTGYAYMPAMPAPDDDAGPRRPRCAAAAAPTVTTGPVGARVAVGAAWMIGLKFLERAIGFVSTLVLARLLLPADFGLVAMAMAVFAFVEVAGSFGFDVALIRDQQAGRAHYDSAWTLQVGYGLLAALLLVALSWPAASYFAEPRLLPVMWILAGVAFVQSLENIGIVNFRKEFQYGRDFWLMLSKKLVGFVVTLGLALAFRNYWALIGGIVSSRLAGVVLSYLMHPYRPRLETGEIRGLMSFSQWMVVTRLIAFLRDRGPDFLLGRFLDVASLGIYRIGREVATLPTSELLFPVMRAVYPGYAALAGDRRDLARGFLAVQGLILMLALPAAACIVILADPIVRVLLGPNWLTAVPIIQVLGIYGALTMFQATNLSIFQVLGVPQRGALLNGVEVALLLGSMTAVLAWRPDVGLAVWCVVIVRLLVVPLGTRMISRLLPIGGAARAAVAVRPIVAGAVLTAAVYAVGNFLPAASDSASAVVRLAVQLPIAAASYIGAVLLLWRISGKPPGAEQRLIDMVNERLRAARS